MRQRMKTHKGAAKRFRIGARGRIKSNRSSANHLKSTKSGKQIRRIRRTAGRTDTLALQAARTLRRGR